MCGSSDSSRRAGFTLIEILVAMALVCSALGFATALIVNANKRFRSGVDAADAHIDMRRAADRLAGDIRGASKAAAGDKSLALTGADGSRIIWRLREGRLVRTGAEGEMTWRTDLADMKVAAKRVRPGSPFIEIALEVKGAEDKRGQVFYVGACPRVTEGK